MRIDASARRKLWLQNLLFALLLGSTIGLLAWLSTRYSLQADWTFGGRNTLSETSRTLLAGLAEPVRITAYARDTPALRDGITRLVERYRRAKPDLTLAFVNPDLLPDRVRELGVTRDGELYVDYRGRGEKVQQLSEQALTSALQRLSRAQESTVLFLEGHGERRPLGAANYDLGTFGRELEQIGIRVGSFDGSKTPSVPTAAALVIAGPQKPLTPEEVRAVLGHVESGGHLLWLLEPKESANLEPLAKTLGVAVWPGTVVDPDTARLGIKNPAFIPVVDYGPHPITEALRAPALLPQAAALNVELASGWSPVVLLQSQSRAWTELDSLEGTARFEPDRAEQEGPLTVGVALSRPVPAAAAADQASTRAEQRIAVIGDGDFLSNTFLGNGANLQLGLNIVNWLTLADAPLIVRPKIAPDQQLNLSAGALAGLAALFLILVPGGLLAGGWLVWFYRRRR
ncbi:MAG: GldG family protein [Candidatus Competibacteraceae bacterium]|nr:GldG family protein [Candidatus Competibacteraceae bacterium]